MKTLFKLSLPRYKWIVTFSYLFLLSLLPLVNDLSDITLLMDRYFCLLPIVFFSDILLMEYMGKNIEIFKLKSHFKKRKIICIRILLNLLMLTCISIISFGIFFLVKDPYIDNGESIMYHLLISIIVIFLNSLIFGLISFIISNIFSNKWAGIGFSICTWFFLISQSGKNIPVALNIFMYGTRDLNGNPSPTGELWVYGKIVVSIVLLIVGELSLKWMKRKNMV